LIRHHHGSLWITCQTQFQGWKHPLAAPRTWTPVLPRRRSCLGGRASTLRALPKSRLPRFPQCGHPRNSPRSPRVGRGTQSTPRGRTTPTCFPAISMPYRLEQLSSTRGPANPIWLPIVICSPSHLMDGDRQANGPKGSRWRS
jgi:hypothetical protein